MSLQRLALKFFFFFLLSFISSPNYSIAHLVIEDAQELKLEYSLFVVVVVVFFLHGGWGEEAFTFIFPFFNRVYASLYSFGTNEWLKGQVSVTGVFVSPFLCI